MPKTIYIDADFRVHLSNPTGEFRVFDVEESFDGKCDAYIEGMRYVPSGESWMRDDGVVFEGEMISPWKPYSELAAAQKQFEEDEKVIAELDAALLDMTYQNIIGSIE